MIRYNMFIHVPTFNVVISPAIKLSKISHFGTSGARVEFEPSDMAAFFIDLPGISHR